MKKILAFVLLAVLAIISSASAQTCDCENLQAQIDALTMQVQNLTDLFDAYDTSNFHPNSNISDTVVRSLEPVIFKDCSISFQVVMLKSDSRDTALEVYMTFQNISETETINFISQVRIKAFQDGFGLLEGRNRGATKNLRPGKEMAIRKSFGLTNSDSPVELEFIPIGSDAAPEIRIINLPVQ